MPKPTITGLSKTSFFSVAISFGDIGENRKNTLKILNN